MTNDHLLSIALVTCDRLGGLTQDDQLLHRELVRAGASVGVEVWNTPAADRWPHYDRIVLRSTWDYHLQPQRFRDWVNDREVARRLVNPAGLVTWNMDKRYLLNLASSGVPVVPTVLVSGDAGEVSRVAAEHGWDRVVLKPVISADGWNTVLMDPGDGARLQTWLDQVPAGVIMQPFRPQVTVEGEWSLIFLGGSFSHAVLKTAAQGDFRVQESFGGAATAVEADPEAIHAAGECLAVVPGKADYARVDLVRSGGVWEVMEVELIEPSLFLSSSPGAAGALARTLLAGPGPG